MLIKSLTLTNIRAFNHAKIMFQPGMNLIVGINGVGKSTILDTLRILISKVLPKLSQSRSKALKFEESDISISDSYLSGELTFTVTKHDFSHSEIYYRDSLETPNSLTIHVVSQWPPQNEAQLFKDLKLASEQPLVLYFSPRRALPNSNKNTDKTKGHASAFSDALAHRELRITEFADWWIAQDTLLKENDANAQRHLNALNDAIAQTMDNYTNICAHREVYDHNASSDPDNPKITPKVSTTLTIDKGGIPLQLSQLSDGERSILALVLDLARRLSISNPNLDDPLQAQAVVLIDELDLHLHPQWQRSIVQKLTTTFPNCQFIATTHSPLIIGEVAPESVILIAEDGEIIHPHQSLGMDTDWILKYIMGATTRQTETTLELKRIADLIETEDYDEATDAIDILRDKIGEFPELVRLQTRIDRFQMLGD